ncbi:MAG: DUF4399 domain-containing protein [Rhodocyclaceae bacterium]|nr:DUF4399 domain-containing protein [Rhodocyclaceae bacterium]MCP5231350.1 DUF4399 domain-containing protein [Zoogloeaceae bacterium]MCB1911528.1 DUF4399 domain-containing protein [Rhodocyclaceae bacterium]MCP5240832.1 DUF4399 domain-containing protein [Zoogloeaceae bacterium]MCP5255272.1 DUF4399 domain-containing protein [Zoogloeaceae bacterium]
MNIPRQILFGILTTTLLAAQALAGGRVMFLEPVDGATVASEFTVRMGVEGMTVAPAGQLLEGTGHHHLIVDGKAVPKGSVVPADATHMHFGKGQTETTLKLPPGKHTLTLQFADGAHQSYGPELSTTIAIEVK